MQQYIGTFHPGKYSDVPLYNIQAVAEATGVPSITLRSWERRYGVPEPKRDAKGYRLYSERDIAVTHWLRERVQQGIGISRAVHMLRVLTGAESDHAPASAFDPETMRARLMGAAVQLDSQGIARVLSEALIVGSVEDVALSVIQPVLYQIGDGWSSGKVSVTMEHVASAQLRSHLEQLIHISPSPLRSERFVVGCAPSEMHELGALMLALFLRRRGFDVVYAGASVEPASLVTDALHSRATGVLLSAMTAVSAGLLSDVFRELGGCYSGILAFGGKIYNDCPDLIVTTPGSYLGRDAKTAVETLEGLLPGRAA